MKTKYLIIVLLFFVTKTITAQDPNNHWQMGTTNINFTTGQPATQVVTNGKYGQATVSDNSGNLLFYANSWSVFNKNHQQMNGSSSFTTIPEFRSDVKQPVVIVPFPGNDQKFYVFYAILDQDLCITCSYAVRYRYSIVDFSDAQFPLGKIINGACWVNNSCNALKNTTFGPLTVIKNATNDGYFVIIHSFDGSTFNFDGSVVSGGKLLAYKITDQGLNLTPIETVLPNNINYMYKIGLSRETTTTGTIKFTPNGLKMGELLITKSRFESLYSSWHTFFTLDFNNSTGTFSNFTLVDSQPFASNTTQNNQIIEDFEFSNDSEKVFFSNKNLFVKNMINVSLPRRNLTQNGQTNIPTGFWRLQRDKFNNIIVSSSNNFLHKIENQNSYLNSTINVNFLQANNNIFYLPQLIPSLNQPCPNNLIVSSNVQSGTDNRQAQNSITASNTISNGAYANYHAGTSIILTPSFTAFMGSQFHAYIGGCNENTTPSIIYQKTARTTNELKLNVQIFPNPNNGIFKIDIGKVVDGSLEITNLIGELVLSLDFKSQSEFEVNIENKPKGFYIIKVVTADQVITTKIYKN